VVVFTGHNHVHSVAYRQVIAFVQTAAVLDSSGCRVIEVGEGRVRVDFRPISDRDFRSCDEKLSAPHGGVISKYGCFGLLGEAGDLSWREDDFNVYR